MKNKEKVLVTDGNNFMMRANYAYKELTLKSGQKSGMVYGYIKLLQNYVTKYVPDYVIPLFDSGRSSYRTSICADYKGTRPEKSYEMLTQMRACREATSLLGFEPYIEENVEADDLAAKVAKDCKDKFVMLVSTDHDWQQLVKDKKVIQIKPGMRGASDEVVEYTVLKEAWGWEPERWAEIAAIMGDPGDNVIGIRGYGWKKSLTLLKKYGDLWSACRQDATLASNASRVLDNYKLTKLDGTVATIDVPIKSNKLSKAKDNLDKDKFIDFCDKWELNSIKEQIENDSFWN